MTLFTCGLRVRRCADESGKLGEPSTVSERVEQGLVVTIYEFPRGEGRILIAEFISDALVRTRIETRSQADDRATGRSEYSRNDPLATSLLTF